MAEVFPTLRTPIRRYLVDMLKEQVDIGQKVFPNRPSPVFIEEVPCILIHFGSETSTIIVGDKYNPKVYENNLLVNIDVLADEFIDPSNPINGSQNSEDFLDFVTWQAMQAVHNDPILAKRLSDYNEENPCGLSYGISLLNSEPYTIETGSDRRIVAQRSQIQVPYEMEAIPARRLKTFEEYSIKINQVGWNVTTVDPTLSEAEGEL